MHTLPLLNPTIGFRNWSLILPKLRAFILKHNQVYVRHERGPEAFRQFIAIHLTAIRQAGENLRIKKTAPALGHGSTALATDGKSPKNWESIIALAMESLLAFLEKFINDLDANGLLRHQEALNAGVEEIMGLDDQDLILLVQGYHPINKIAAALLKVSGGSDQSLLVSGRGPVQPPPAGATGFDLAPFARLYTRLLAIDYHYWLSEEDPLPWFTAACGHTHGEWDVTGLFAAISHSAMQGHLAALEPRGETPGAPADQLRHLLTLPTHLEIVQVYKEIPARLLTVPFPNASYPGPGSRPVNGNGPPPLPSRGPSR